MNLIKEKYPKIIKEIRGRGLLIGIQLYKDQSKFIQKLLDYKLLTIRAAENVVRILPPLNVKKSELDQAIKIIDKICVGWEDGLNPLIIGIDIYFLNSSNFISLSVLSMKALPKFDNIFAVSSILSPPFDKCSSSGLSVKVLPPSCFIAK